MAAFRTPQLRTEAPRKPTQLISVLFFVKTCRKRKFGFSQRPNHLKSAETFSKSWSSLDAPLLKVFHLPVFE
jgi:hypothetical protein